MLVSSTTTAPDDIGRFFVSRRELGVAVGLSRYTIDELGRQGIIREIAYGRRRLIPISEVARVAASIERCGRVVPYTEDTTTENS